MAKSKRRRYPLDNVVNRLASWPDLLARVLSSLRDPLDVVRASGVCRDWRRAARRDDVWAAHCERYFFHPVPGYHVEVRRCDIGAVPAHAEALRSEGFHRLAFREAFADRRRNWLTRDELCGITWRFRFKRDAGMCDGDPWWNGGAARRNPFRRDGTCGLEPGPSSPHRWTFASDIYGVNMQREIDKLPEYPTPTHNPLSDCYHFSEEARKDMYGGVLTPTPPGLLPGSVIKVYPGAQFPNDLGPEPHITIATYPAAVVRRHPKTWGWILESCWTLQTSWEMPSLALERRARGDLMDAKLPIGLDLQQDEVGNFFATTDASFLRPIYGPAAVVSSSFSSFHVDGALPSEEFLAPWIEDEEFAPTTVHVLAGPSREPGREPSRVETTLRLPRALARWTCARAWNRGVLDPADASIMIPEPETEATKGDDAGRSRGLRRSRRLSSR